MSTEMGKDQSKSFYGRFPRNSLINSFLFQPSPHFFYCTLLLLRVNPFLHEKEILIQLRRGVAAQCLTHYVVPQT